MVTTKFTRRLRDRIHAAIDLPKHGHSQPIGKPMEVAGWCFFKDGPAHFIELRLDGKLLMVERLNYERPDVPALYSPAGSRRAPVGFQFLVDLVPGIAEGPHQLEFIALDEGHRRIPIGEVNFEAVMPSAARSFSQRFAEIPSHLVAKVNSTLSEAEFTAIGSIVANTLEQYAVDLNSVTQILDFGCGLGRVMAPMLAKAPQAEFTGFDIDPMMLDWCRHLLPDARCRLVSSLFDLPDNAYDLIYVVSVFTHLDVTADFWLAEIQRILKPTGKAFITYHDDTLFEEIVGGPSLPDLPPGTKLHDRYVAGRGTQEGGVVMGTFYTTEYWESLLAQRFSIACSVPRGLFGHQSFSIITKKQVMPDRTTGDREYMRVIERELFELRRATHVMF